MLNMRSFSEEDSSINFQNYQKIFDSATSERIETVYAKIGEFVDSECITDAAMVSFEKQLGELANSDFKMLEDSALEITKEEIFSQFLQNLICYCCSFPDFCYLNLLTHIINIEGFFVRRTDPNRGIVIWIEPKHGHTALSNLCIIDAVDAVTENELARLIAVMLKKATQACDSTMNGPDLQSLQRLLTYGDKNGFTVLNSAAIANHVAIVKTLIETATQAFDLDGQNPNWDGFQAFLMHKTYKGDPSLHTACKKGHIEVVRALLSSVAQVYDSHSDKEQFSNFINQIDTNGCTAFSYVFEKFVKLDEQANQAVKKNEEHKHDMVALKKIEEQHKHDMAAFSNITQLLQQHGAVHPFNKEGKRGHKFWFDPTAEAEGREQQIKKQRSAKSNFGVAKKALSFLHGPGQAKSQINPRRTDGKDSKCEVETENEHQSEYHGKLSFHG